MPKLYYMIIGIPRETFAGENRVALVPDAVAALAADVQILLESDAGRAAGFAVHANGVLLRYGSLL